MYPSSNTLVLCVVVFCECELMLFYVLCSVGLEMCIHLNLGLLKAEYPTNNYQWEVVDAGTGVLYRACNVSPQDTCGTLPTLSRHKLFSSVKNSTCSAGATLPAVPIDWLRINSCSRVGLEKLRYA